MSQPIRSSSQESGGVAVGLVSGTPDVGTTPATRESAVTPDARPVDRSRLGAVLALVGTGLLMQGGADALARSGHGSPALSLFLCGIALSFGACAWRLTSARATRRERISVSLALGLGLLASYVMLQPLLLNSFDELAHVGTLTRVLDSRNLFPANSVLPVSPYYPGLELATSAVKWLTGLPLVLSQLVVLAAVRVVLVLGVFLVVERACHSSRAGGVGVLVYAASPQFYGFDAQYAYETIALAFAVAVVYLLFASIDSPRPHMGRAFVLALASLGAVVISHHVTGWLTVAFLVVWFAGLYLTSIHLRLRSFSGRRALLAPFTASPVDTATEPPMPSEEEQTPRSVALSGNGSLGTADEQLGSGDEHVNGQARFGKRRRSQARIVGIATAVGLAIGGAWTIFVGRLLAPYLGPLFSAAVTEISATLGSGHGNRSLFTSAAGGGSPGWEILLILVSAAGWCIILLPSLYSLIFRRSVRGGALRYLPAVIAATYPLSVLANVSSGSKLVAERATTFIFFGVAVVVGAWLARRISKHPRFKERLATIGVATVVFLGSLLFGIGPLVSLLPGPYRVGADSLSYGSPSLALAHWADTHLPAGSHVAADKDNAVLLNAIGGVDAVTAEGGLVNPELLYFDHRLSLYDIYLIRKADIRYLVVDDRLAHGPPLYGTYIADGEPPKRLTLGELDKFNTYRFIKRIYDNGPIQVYDLTQLLPASARAAPAGPVVGGSGLNVGIFVMAASVALLWSLRLLRRSGPIHDLEHKVFCGVVAALVIGVFGGFLIRLTHAPPEVVAVIMLFVLLVLSLRPDTSLVPFRTLFDRRLRGTPEVAPDVVVDPAFYQRKEIKDVLAYVRVLVNPGDDTSTRRIVNVPKRGIGTSSVSRMSAWARTNHTSLSVAIDHAEEVGLRGKALQGAQQLSMLLGDLRSRAQTTHPGDLVRLVVGRTGYEDELMSLETEEANARIENLVELAHQAGDYADAADFAERVIVDHRARLEAIARQREASRRHPTPAQLILGGLGVALFAAGAVLATVPALKDWTPPPELSITTSTSNRSVADVQLGSAGPVAATLEITRDGRTLWSSSLARTTAAQSVVLPARDLREGSRVVLVSEGRALRRVDGWVRTVPKLVSGPPRRTFGHAR